MAGIRRSTQRATQAGLKAAVHRHKPFSRRGMQERLFTFAFSKLVYPQIWEDPDVDREALQLQPGDRLIGIASGGCNALSYLVDDPQEIIAVDLNGAHIALNRLKLVGLATLATYDEFFQFFGRADLRENIALYDEKLRPQLDESTRAYWDGRDISGRRRIDAFARNFYRHGLLGRFIGAGHVMAKLYGARLDAVLQADSLPQQREAFEREIAPLFEKRFVRWLTKRPSALVWARHPAGPISRACRGRSRWHRRRAQAARRTARLRLSGARQLFCLAGVWSQLRVGRRTRPAALSAGAALRGARGPARSA